jgi:hypothetical protein
LPGTNAAEHRFACSEERCIAPIHKVIASMISFDIALHRSNAASNRSNSASNRRNAATHRRNAARFRSNAASCHDNAAQYRYDAALYRFNGSSLRSRSLPIRPLQQTFGAMQQRQASARELLVHCSIAPGGGMTGEGACPFAPVHCSSREGR